jgi:hypothetical protein
VPAQDLTPYTTHIEDQELEELKYPLRATRWATDLNNEDGHCGIRTTDLRGLVDYWIEGFDWRVSERRIDEFDHYRVEVS